MVDLVKLQVKAGDGGDGRISFLRTRYQAKGGPDGGDGGRGGSVVLVGSKHLQSLRDFAGKLKIEAKPGEMGGPLKKHGKDADDVFVRVPTGTRVWRVVDGHEPVQPTRMYRIDREAGRIERPKERREAGQVIERKGVFELRTVHTESRGLEEVIETPIHPEQRQGDIAQIRIGNQTISVEFVGDVVDDAQELVIARGGKGGRGNWQFRSSMNTTPREAETGEKGERGTYIFELQLLADVGLIGFPNSGKSTLLSVLTKANPKIAAYPFTTLEPNLGMLDFEAATAADRQQLLLADIPGIIEGASQGKGLGYEFLRHIARCDILLFVLGKEGELTIQLANSPGDLFEALYQQYQDLNTELEEYEQQVMSTFISQTTPFRNKKRVVVANKIDLLPAETIEAVSQLFAKKKLHPMFVSAKTTQGIDMLKNTLRELAFG